MLEARSKFNANSNEKVVKVINKLKEGLAENCENLERVSCELDKVTLYLERYLDERQRQKLQEEAL
jgi:hypothetical protein